MTGLSSVSGLKGEPEFQMRGPKQGKGIHLEPTSFSGRHTPAPGELTFNAVIASFSETLTQQPTETFSRKQLHNLYVL